MCKHFRFVSCVALCEFAWKSEAVACNDMPQCKCFCVVFFFSSFHPQKHMQRHINDQVHQRSRSS